MALIQGISILIQEFLFLSQSFFLDYFNRKYFDDYFKSLFYFFQEKKIVIQENGISYIKNFVLNMY